MPFSSLRTQLVYGLSLLLLTVLAACAGAPATGGRLNGNPTGPGGQPTVAYLDDDLPRSAGALHQLELIGERGVPPEGDEGFHIDPASPLLYGIDVSHYQQNIDWSKVAAGKVIFAYTKASEGIYRDRSFERNWPAMARNRQQAEAAGARRFYRGAYHFFRATTDPSQQAENFVQTVRRLEPGDLPPTLDLEWDWSDVRHQSGDRWDALTREERIRRVKLWLETVERKLGRPPMIYTNFHFWQDKFGDYQPFAHYPLWIADYSSLSANAGKPVYLPRLAARWALWQLSCYGVIPGNAGFADVDRFNGSLEELDSLAGLAPDRAGDASAILARGSRGPAVEQLQTDLFQLGHLSAKDRASGPGLFGPRTERALLSFQRTNYLTRTGMYDEATRQALEALKAGYRQGAASDVVRAAKERLVRLGHLPAKDIVKGSGSLGLKTEAGLRRFQAASGIPADGVLNVATYHALWSVETRDVPPDDDWAPQPAVAANEAG